MYILIDGYNLLFQSPLVGRGRGPGWLERARKKLIVHLHANLAEDLLRQTTIVFDASQVGEAGADFRTEQGISVLFARLHPEADDLLEEMIRKHSSPKSLTVVSSDHRIRRCARARRAKDVDSERFLRHLNVIRTGLIKGAANERLSKSDLSGKPNQTLAGEEVDYWLKKFDLNG